MILNIQFAFVTFAVLSEREKNISLIKNVILEKLFSKKKIKILA